MPQKSPSMLVRVWDQFLHVVVMALGVFLAAILDPHGPASVLPVVCAGILGSRIGFLAMKGSHWGHPVNAVLNLFVWAVVLHGFVHIAPEQQPIFALLLIPATLLGLGVTVRNFAQTSEGVRRES
ncbi:MAG: hypothetical protein LCH41_04795 [Armatimonadetes bacterium]|nr:hypothetical protein [Armatimonadota bacterium]